MGISEVEGVLLEFMVVLSMDVEHLLMGVIEIEELVYGSSPESMVLLIVGAAPSVGRPDA